MAPVTRAGLRLTVDDPTGPVTSTVDDALLDDAGNGKGTRPRGRVAPLSTLAADRVEGRRRYEVVVDGWRFEVTVESEARAALRDRATRDVGERRGHAQAPIRAQIPGRVVSVHVAPGDAVEVGQRLLSIEAMKMENEVRAPRAGTIKQVRVAPGERVELGDELVVVA
jgi:biotin carboxyl carrier protein